ncbi:MAG TPA: hypothetical protein VJM69_05830, partial [Dehalococcoidia bacterium]|nr:hypothetical protein [Dehalococcoidia bacterium]
MPEPHQLSIHDLPGLVQALPAEERLIFERVFRLSVATGRLYPPPAMHRWVESHFGSLEDTLEQTVIRLTNEITLEEALFNPLRSRRPIWRANPADLEEELSTASQDPLANPYDDTPEDLFGRVKGRYCVTASNMAKFDGFHALVVFKEPHPLKFSREMVHDYIDTSLRWAERAQQYDPSAIYYLFMWNCLWRAGASLSHGHAQVVLGRGRHYGQVERLRRCALDYESAFGRDYFQDLYRAHAAVGCAFQRGEVRVLAYLTPRKENEAALMAPTLSAALKDGIYDALACYRDRLGVTSFNLVIYHPPIGPSKESWESFPVMVRILDRGEAASRTADMGAMELYAASVVTSDPLRLAA